MSISLIERLPVELLHQIFENIDAETILLSIRLVSKLFRSVVKTYDRYVLNFHLISKSSFYIICRLINPENVISLTLSNDYRTSNQITLFISFVRLEQFTRLRSLTLLQVDELQLQFILQRVNLSLLTAYSFAIREYDKSSMKTTTDLLMSLTTRSSLQKMEFNLPDERLSRLSWPTNCSIQCLTINNAITMNYLFTILERSPHLHTLNINSFQSSMINNLTSSCFRQLSSLTIKEVSVTINELEAFLLMTPSLVYLKLIGRGEMTDGQRWEEFITIDLSQLKKFEFYFSNWKLTDQTRKDLELIISSFQTSFWIEHKKWFVTCEYNIPWSNSIHVYSIPICKSSLMYTARSQKVSLFTYPMMINSDRSITNNIDALTLILNKSLADDIQEKKTATNNPLFSKVTGIELAISEDWPLLSLQSLSVLIDISRIVRMTISTDYANIFKQDLFIDISIFMEQACNLSLLIIRGNFHKYKSGQTTENIYSILPRHVKHLEIATDVLDKIEMILERCKNLATISFMNSDKKFIEKVFHWFGQNTINTTCQENLAMASIWLGKRQIQSTGTRLVHKRTELIDNNCDFVLI